MQYRLVVPNNKGKGKKRPIPSLNEYTVACRSNAFAGASLKKKAEEHILKCIREQHLGHIDSPVMVHFYWVEQDKRRDKDNIVFGHKFFFDALVKGGILDDDKWDDVIGFTDTFLIDKDNPRVEVEIWHQE